jgi:predicted enzyme related to lactoylglutathione lyase
MSAKVQVTFDAGDPHRLAAWWAELMGYEVEDHHDRVAGLLADGTVTEEQVVRVDGRLYFAEATAASDPAGGGPRLFFQKVPEAKVAKNRVHLDVAVAGDDLEGTVERQVARGATFVGYGSHPGVRWAVMQDPEGNEFCVH